MTGRPTLRCVGFKPHCRGSLRGFASIAFVDLRMTVHGIGIHVHENGAAWASPPAQALIKNGAAMKDERGTVQYSPPLLEFGSAEIRRAWSDRVVAEVLPFSPSALECREERAA
jgi:hypothetical protein